MKNIFYWGIKMEERRFKVLIDDMVVAEKMDLTTATILIKALFQEYYNDRTMMVTVKDEYRDAEAKREYLEDKYNEWHKKFEESSN